jgi:hypothetical protein
MACPEIYVADNATIGAAVSFSVGEDGKPMNLPADVAEKFQSAWRAVCRKAAENGGHNPLLADAMIDTSLVLTMRTGASGKPLIERGGSGEAIKPGGKILTMTAKEACRCGLADGAANTLDALAEKLSLKGWNVLANATSAPSLRAGQLSALQLSKALADRVDALKLRDHNLTRLQHDAALKDIQDWFKKQEFIGRQVEWPLTVVECTTSEGAEAADKLKVEYAQLKKQLEDAKANLGTGGDAAAVQRLQDQLGHVTVMLRFTVEHPIYMRAIDPDSQMLVRAYIVKESRDAALKIARGDEAVVAGKIAELRCHDDQQGGLLLLVVLEGCRVRDPAAKPPGPSTGAAAGTGTASATPATAPAGSGKAADTPANSSAEEAKRELSLARNYLANGMKAKALEMLQAIVRDHPDAPAAADAREELRRAGKQ